MILGLLAVPILAAGCTRRAQAVRVVAVSSRFAITSVQVTVPRSLRASDANLLYPVADIVWTGEPEGDRYAQVARIFAEAGASATARTASASVAGLPAATLQLEVSRFHALSTMARDLTGGVHDIGFVLSVTENGTGRVLDGPRAVRTQLAAYGGRRAIVAERDGRGERDRITAHLASVLRGELAGVTPDVAAALATAPDAAVPQVAAPGAAFPGIAAARGPARPSDVVGSVAP